MTPDSNLSFEFFPPNTPEGMGKLRDVRARAYVELREAPQ